MTTALDDRYGRSPRRRIRARWVAIIVGALMLIVVAAWVVWVGLLSTPASIETQDIGATIIDASTVELREGVTVDPGTRVTCSFQALDGDFAIVGWKVVQLPAATERSRVITERLRTSAPAVSGLIGSCWLT
jgi:hypothetical protein